MPRSHVVLSVVFLCLLTAACGETIEPLVVSSADRRIIVTNTSDEAWTNVEVWVNHYYRAIAPRLDPKGRMEAPLGSFVASYGQKFDPAKQSVVGVEVTATSASGEPVTLTWGEGRKR